jgi:hypothetical protein
MERCFSSPYFFELILSITQTWGGGAFLLVNLQITEANLSRPFNAEV